MKKPELDSELMARLFPATLGAKKAAREKAEQKAEEIMRRAVKDADLLESITERASIQWEQGLSDSLYQTVLRRLIDTQERIERDVNGKVILKSPTNWEAELEKYRR